MVVLVVGPQGVEVVAAVVVEELKEVRAEEDDKGLERHVTSAERRVHLLQQNKVSLRSQGQQSGAPENSAKVTLAHAFTR